MNILRYFETFRTCETERAPNARQNNGFFFDFLTNLIKPLAFDEKTGFINQIRLIIIA